MTNCNEEGKNFSAMIEGAITADVANFKAQNPNAQFGEVPSDPTKGVPLTINGQEATLDQEITANNAYKNAAQAIGGNISERFGEGGSCAGHLPAVNVKTAIERGIKGN